MTMSMCLVQPPRSSPPSVPAIRCFHSWLTAPIPKRAKAEVREALLAVRAMLDTLGLDPLAEPWVSAGAAGGAADGTAESARA